MLSKVLSPVRRRFETSWLVGVITGSTANAVIAQKKVKKYNIGEVWSAEGRSTARGASLCIIHASSRVERSCKIPHQTERNSVSVLIGARNFFYERL